MNLLGKCGILNMVIKVKVLKFYVNDLVYALNYLELYCIKKEISYVKLPNEFHFLDYIFQFYSRGTFLSEQKDIEDFDKVFFGITLLENPLEVEALGLKLNHVENCFSMKKNERNLSYKSCYKVNTMGYPKRVRRR